MKKSYTKEQKSRVLERYQSGEKNSKHFNRHRHCKKHTLRMDKIPKQKEKQNNQYVRFSDSITTLRNIRKNGRSSAIIPLYRQRSAIKKISTSKSK